MQRTEFHGMLDFLYTVEAMITMKYGVEITNEKDS